MNTDTPTPEGYEILTPEFLRKHGAQKGMEWSCSDRPHDWTIFADSLGTELPEDEADLSEYLRDFIYAAPIGTMARALAGKATPAETLQKGGDAPCPTANGHGFHAPNAAGSNAAPVVRPDAAAATPAEATPETDGQVCGIKHPQNPQYVKADFARTLERRLAAALARVAELQKPWKVVLTHPIFERFDCETLDVGYADRILVVKCDGIAEKLAKLEARVAELEADKRRIDWLATQYVQGSFYRGVSPGDEMWRWSNVRAKGALYPTYRAAIDAAMNGGAK